MTKDFLNIMNKFVALKFTIRSNGIKTPTINTNKQFYSITQYFWCFTIIDTLRVDSINV